VVNLAALAVRVAAPGEVVSTPAVAEAAGLAARPADRRRLKGFADEVALCVLIGRTDQPA
jgi:class 3 adenylate cyclase